MPQLELGITPLTVELKVGLNVAFFVIVKRPGHVKRKEVHVGTVRCFNDSGVVIDEITIPGMYNRYAHNLFEVHKDLSLVSWMK